VQGSGGGVTSIKRCHLYFNASGLHTCQPDRGSDYCKFPYDEQVDCPVKEQMIRPKEFGPRPKYTGPKFEYDSMGRRVTPKVVKKETHPQGSFDDYENN
jgi:hypothetical protein